ncbi:hypothetical protein [Actinomadura xylanilytica]|uniref:hypothetical protein n=1 Tax=Actinomadura xylanilytica TaxID=887459 RepID=UPI00255AEC35|nr:hypothetical protein [Actinomadura xylanilytica]MDL4776812.1 hypothetical protein [Actinomadura xylanilytica]
MDVFSPIPELNLLKEFYDAQEDFFANGFEMYEYGDEPEDRLVSFAQANGSGSRYGIWRKDDREDLAALPVVAMGDEGGVHVISLDFREFLRLLASIPADCEPDIDWESFGLRECDEPVENKPYLAWLKETFGITPADDWKAIVYGAEAELGKEWAAWVHPIIPDAVWSPVHELNLLPNAAFDGFANGFWLLDEYGEDGGLENPELTADLAPFATNDSDTFFALWRLDDRPDLPVVALGTTAGAHVVARNVREFYQLVAALTDTEIWCDETRVGLRPCEPAAKRTMFLSWLEETFGLRPTDDPAAVIATARAELGERLATRPARG